MTASTRRRSTRRAGTRSCARTRANYVDRGRRARRSRPSPATSTRAPTRPRRATSSSSPPTTPARTTCSRRSCPARSTAATRQGGLLVYTDDGNYVKFDAISDEGNTRINRIELRSEVGDAVQQPQPQADVPVGHDRHLAAADEGGRRRTAGEYSFDGTTWTALAQPRDEPAWPRRASASSRSASTTPAARSRSTTSRSTASSAARSRRPRTPRRRSSRSTASPTSGFGPLQVAFNVSATDADGDALTYSWDFDGDGTEDSTVEDPSHTYTAPGVYEAEVTVSDGEAERSQTVTVTVLAADDPNARFRVLVFSKTTGFRHDSIDEGIAAIQALGQRERVPGRRDRGRERVPRLGAGPLRHRGLPVDDGRSFERRPAGRLRALHPRGRRLRRHPRSGRHRVRLELVRPPGGRLLPEPPARHARRDGRCRGPHEPLDRAPACALGAHGRVVQLPLAGLRRSRRAGRRLQPA